MSDLINFEEIISSRPQTRSWTKKVQLAKQDEHYKADLLAEVLTTTFKRCMTLDDTTIPDTQSKAALMVDEIRNNNSIHFSPSSSPSASSNDINHIPASSSSPLRKDHEYSSSSTDLTMPKTTKHTTSHAFTSIKPNKSRDPIQKENQVAVQPQPQQENEKEEKRPIPLSSPPQAPTCEFIIINSELLDQEVVKMSKVLNNLSEEWTARVQKLQRIQYLMEQVPPNLSSGVLSDKVLFDFLSQIIHPVIVQTSDIRSSIVKEACLTISTISTYAKHQASLLVNEFLGALFQLLFKTIKVMSAAGDESIRNLVSNLDPAKVITVVLQHTSSPHPAVREKCFEYASIILGRDEYRMDTETILLLGDSIRNGLADSAANVRQTSKSCFQVYTSFYSQQAKTLFDSLEPSLQKRLETSSSPNSNTMMTKKKLNTREGFRGFLKEKNASFFAQQQQKNVRYTDTAMIVSGVENKEN